MSSNESSPHSSPAETDCLVCGSGKSFPKNPILFCDGPGCDIPVHQKCYGVKVVPEGNWYCQRCEDRIPVNNTPSCCCPQTTGAFKRTTIPNQYIHVACARFHPDLNENEDPIDFNPAFAGKRACCLCKSDFGVCSECTVESCSRHMHVTCAQNDALMVKGKSPALFCDLHRDIGALSRVINSQGRRRSEIQGKERSSASALGSTFQRSTKGSRSYRESSDESEEYDENEEDEEDEEDEDEEMLDAAAEDESEDDNLRKSFAQSSSTSSALADSKGHSRNKRSLDATDRRRKRSTSDSEEIDVDDTEAVLGSSTGGGASGSKKAKAIKAGPKESAAESQRRRLLMSLDKSKKKQGSGSSSSSSSGSGGMNMVNLTNMPIRTLGGAGVQPTSSILGSGSGGESKQKLPGISRYSSSSSSSNNGNVSGFEGSSNPYALGSGLSPSAGSTERFSGGQSNGRGANDQPARNLKGLTFDLDPSIDASTLKTSSPLLGSAAPSPIFSNFSNSGSPIHPRQQQQQYQQQQYQLSPKSGSSAISEDVGELQNVIRILQTKAASLESAMQVLTMQKQQLQQQLSSGSSSSSNNNSPKLNVKGNTASTHTVGAPGQDLQYKFDMLQHHHAEEKMRNLTLRNNLRDLFGFLQVPVGAENGGVIEWNGDRLDEYVQALRSSVVGSDSSSISSSGASSRAVLDVKRRDMVVDRVLKEIGS